MNTNDQTMKRKPVHNSTYPKGGVSCSKDRFVVNETFVLLINICGESPALRVAAKRYVTPLKKMRRKYNICFLILLTISTINAQSKRQFTKVQNSVNEQKLYELAIEKLNTKKKDGCLIYKSYDNIAVKYCDNKSEDKFVEFDELGKIKNTDIIVVNKFTYNEEFYILINPKKSKTLTLYGFPLRIENTNKYVVYNNPATDIPYSIQILEMKNGEMKLIAEILYPSNITVKKVLRVDDSEIYILDNKNQTWKTSINKKGVT